MLLVIGDETGTSPHNPDREWARIDTNKTIERERREWKSDILPLTGKHRCLPAIPFALIRVHSRFGVCLRLFFAVRYDSGFR